MTFRLNDQPLTDVQRTAMRTDLGVRDLSTGEIGTLDRGEARESHLLTKVAYVDTTNYQSYQLFQVGQQQQGVTGAVAGIVAGDPIIYEAGTQTVLAGGDSGVTIHVGTEVRADDGGDPSFYRWSGTAWAEVSQPAVVTASGSSSYLPGYQIPYDQLRQNRQAAFVMLMGQSNADGTQTLPLNEQVTSFANVFILSRSTTISNSAWTDESTWNWTNFTTQSSQLNLGLNKSGHFKNLTTEFAREWQSRIDGGENLPDLYLVHMSWSGNGFGNSVATETRFNPNERFAASRENIWNGTLKLHNWALNNLINANNQVIHLGINHNQWEHDAKVQSEADAYQSWIQSFLHEHDRISGIKTPFTYVVPATDGPNGAFISTETIKNAFSGINDRNVVALDPAELPAYNEAITTSAGYRGIYHDQAHYDRVAFDGLEDQIWSKGGHRGLLMTAVRADDFATEHDIDTKLRDYSTTSTIDGQIARATNKTQWDANEYTAGTDAIALSGVTQYTSGSNPGNVHWEVTTEDDGRKYFRIADKPSTYSFLFFSGIPSDTRYGTLETRIRAGSRISLAAAFSVNDLSGATFQSTQREYIALSLACDTEDSNVAAENPDQYVSQVWHLDNTATRLTSLVTSNTGLPLGSGTSGSTEDVDLRFSCLPGNSGTQWDFTVSYKLTTEDTYRELFRHDNVDVSGMSTLGGGIGVVLGLGHASVVDLTESIRFKNFRLISEE